VALGSSADAVQASQGDKKLKVVVTGGHPGDPEYGCGGTIARYTDAGHEVTLLYFNRGEKGCSGKSADACSAIRVSEARQACGILKATPRFANQIDGDAIVDGPHYDAFRRLLETQKPDVLFAQWPIDNHRDHRAVSMLAYDAWLTLGKSIAFYYYEVSDGEDTRMFAPTDYVDVTATEARKRAACYSHASQAPEKFYPLQSQIMRFRGLESGHREAEAFVRHVASVGGLLP
jgi:LmbE family N-acetylglucosaminyl deacetylase